MKSVFRKKFLADYCSFYISGDHAAKIPVEVERFGFWENADCILVQCLPWNEGKTELTVISDPSAFPSGPPALDRSLPTPNNKVLFYDANYDLFDIAVPGGASRIRIWANYEQCPDKVTVAVGG